MSNCPADERDVSLCCPPHIVAYIERLVRERDEALKHNELLTDHYEAKMQGSERATRLEERAERAEAECERLRERHCETCDLWGWDGEEESEQYPDQKLCGDDSFDVEMWRPPDFGCTNWRRSALAGGE